MFRFALFVISLGLLSACQSNEKTCQPEPLTYSVDNSTVQLTQGSETQLADNRRFILVDAIDGDVTADGIADRAAIVVVDPGGSGSFYYLAVSTSDGCSYTPAGSIFLGDRITVEDMRIMPQGHVDAGMIILGLRFRTDEQPMAEKPAGPYVTRMYRVENRQLIHIEQY